MRLFANRPAWGFALRATAETRSSFADSFYLGASARAIQNVHHGNNWDGRHNPSQAPIVVGCSAAILALTREKEEQNSALCMPKRCKKKSTAAKHHGKGGRSVRDRQIRVLDDDNPSDQAFKLVSVFAYLLFLLN